MGAMTEPAEEKRTVVVVGPDGQPVGTMQLSGQGSEEEDGEDPGSLVQQPAKVMRIGSMIKQLLEEVRAALREELERLSLPFEEGNTPSEAELRIAQAQLVGWLEGLFHGIQAALMAQQMAARLQLEQIRGARPALPPGFAGAGSPPGQQLPPGEGGRTGQYL